LDEILADPISSTPSVEALQEQREQISEILDIMKEKYEVVKTRLEAMQS
jgi:hypothetical protein